jgi:hypothetical protein
MKQIFLEQFDQPVLRKLHMDDTMLMYADDIENPCVHPRTLYELTSYRSAGSWIVAFDGNGDCYGVVDSLSVEAEQLLLHLVTETDMEIKEILEFIEL